MAKCKWHWKIDDKPKLMKTMSRKQGQRNRRQRLCEEESMKKNPQQKNEKDDIEVKNGNH